MSTSDVKIEARSNSRPMCTIRSSDEDPILLTSDYLLVGTEILARPESVLEIDLSAPFESFRIKVSPLRYHFWHHCRNEVLNQ